MSGRGKLTLFLSSFAGTMYKGEQGKTVVVAAAKPYYST